MSLSETRIQQILMPALMSKRHNFVVPNVYFFAWESDMVSVSTSGFVSEYEIKISPSDFIADFKKKQKHDALDKRLTNSKKGLPNYFWYVCPPYTIKPEDLPSYAGLIYLDEKRIQTVKQAPRLHVRKITQDQMWKLGKAQMWRMWMKIYAPKGWVMPKRVKRKRRRRR